MLRVTDEVRAEFPSLEAVFRRAEAAQEEYRRRFRRRLLLPRDPLGVIARNAPHFLLASLCRARDLLITVIHSVNGRLPHGTYLATRAHFETAGGVSHLERHLRAFWSGQAERTTVEETLLALSLGARWDREVDTLRKRFGRDVRAVNALTLVGSAAKRMAELTGEADAEQLISERYECLSEYCHPNRAGRRFSVEYLPEGAGVVYHSVPRLTEEELQWLFGCLEGSHLIFLAAFDGAFTLLRENEQLPTLEE